jgi:hypothetical protein
MVKPQTVRATRAFCADLRATRPPSGANEPSNSIVGRSQHHQGHSHLNHVHGLGELGQLGEASRRSSSSLAVSASSRGLPCFSVYVTVTAYAVITET